MRFQKFLPRSGIHHHKIVLTETTRDIRHMNDRHCRHITENRRPHAVHMFHIGKVSGRLRLSAQDEFHKFVLAGSERELERRVEFFLVAESGIRDRAERLATSAPGTVCGQHLNMARHLGDLAQALVKRAGASLLRALQPRGLLEQIRPTRITDKQKIPAQQRNRFVRSAPMVGHQKHHVLGSVSRRVNGAELDVADAECRAVAQRMVSRQPLGPNTPPKFPTFLGKVEPDIWIGRGEFARPADEIRVDVRFRHRRDPQPLLRRNVTIPVDVPLGVDHHRLAAALAAYEVGILRETGIGYLP